MKIGLIVEGGAARTYYSCGVMDEMLKENINNLGKATMEFGKTFKLNFLKDSK